MSIQTPVHISRVRKLMEQAVLVSGTTSTDMWLLYLKIESTYGTSEKTSDVHWRAIKCLDDPEEYITQQSCQAAK
eukprot:m.218095 g.218095  ORF g.218095 m.218095 type:complete len:75 (+) comp15899_c0_seq1:1844-2068(+)